LPNRYVVETIFKHIWTNGLEATDASRLDQLIEQLQPAVDLNSSEIKNRLKELGQNALQQQLFGVPSFVVDDKVFWGLDSLGMLDAYLKGDDWFAQEHWDSVKKPLYGIAKRNPRPTP
jgi:2-hydroxychromene-2-carboxylate isomerase